VIDKFQVKNIGTGTDRSIPVLVLRFTETTATPAGCYENQPAINRSLLTSSPP
jgi:hypothetical protein